MTKTKSRISFVLCILFGLLCQRDWAMAATSVQRRLTSPLTWSSCNTHQICYTLKASDADLGNLINKYYVTPIRIEIFRRTSNGDFRTLRTIEAKEGRWEPAKNRWVLLGQETNHPERETVFNPDLIRN
jgi:hypothetical protein